MRLRAALFLALVAAMPAAAQAVNDYPTSARADYVYGCMKVNGETRQALEKCSCSIDIIASLLPYERYVSAETFMSMGQVVGERGVIFRQSEPARKATDELRRAEAEADSLLLTRHGRRSKLDGRVGAIHDEGELSTHSVCVDYARR